MRRRYNEADREEQIYKKLSTVKEPKQFEAILKSVRNQNKKLIVEIKQFKERIERIKFENKRTQQKQETDKINTEQKNKKLAGQVKSVRKQLTQKYKIMKQLKFQLAKSEGSKIEEVQNDRMKNINQIKSKQKEIAELQKELKDAQVIQIKLNQTQIQTKRQSCPNEPRIKQLQKQNKQLRQKVSSIRKKQYEELSYTIQVQDKLVTNRQKFRQNSLKTLKTSSFPQIAEPSINSSVLLQVKKLQNELQILKQKVAQREQEDQADISKKKKSKNDLITHNKQLMKKHKDLDLKKVKIIQQNNRWKSRWNRIIQIIENQNNKVKKYDMGTQHQEYQDQEPLRRDYAGVINKIRFQDRQILKDDKMCQIIGLMVYEIERGIVTVQAIYSNGMRSYIPIPEHYLQRCKITRAQTSENDFFKLFKIKYNSVDNKIKKLEIRSNKNIKYQYGEKKAWNDFEQGDMIYGFDIGIREYPVCLFGSYSYWKGNWSLQGLGVQINEMAI